MERQVTLAMVDVHFWRTDHILEVERAVCSHYLFLVLIGFREALFTLNGGMSMDEDLMRLSFEDFLEVAGLLC